MFIRQLSYLVALDRERHFGRAAAACHVSQPALSGAIRSIERELGLSIVQRGRRFEGFTPDGERVLSWARKVLLDCEGLRQEARMLEGDPEGVLRMGAIPASLPLVAQLTQACLSQYPRMRHEIHTLAASEIQQRVANFELDVGVTYLDDERLTRFSRRPIFEERYVLVSADRAMFEGAAAMSWPDAAALPLCLFTTNMQCRRGIDAAFAREHARAIPQVETDSMTALCAHIRRAGLYSILPHSALCLSDSAQQLAAIPMTPELRREIGVIYLEHAPQLALLQAALRGFEQVDLQRWVDALVRV